MNRLTWTVFLKKLFRLDRVSNSSLIPRVRSQVPLFLHHPQNLPASLLAIAIAVIETWEAMIWCRWSLFLQSSSSNPFCYRHHLGWWSGFFTSDNIFVVPWLFLHRHLWLYFMVTILKAWEQDSLVAREEDWVLGILSHINNIYGIILYSIMDYLYGLRMGFHKYIWKINGDINMAMGIKYEHEYLYGYKYKLLIN